MTKRPRRTQTRSSILGAAAQRFAEQGYDGTGVAEICERAGVSKGAFYYHFGSKQAVFLTLAESWLEDLDRSLAALRSGEGTVPERLLAMSRQFQRILESQSHRLGLLLEFWTQASRDPTVRQVILTPYRHYQQFFVGLIEDGIEEGSLRPIDPVAGAQALLSIASGLFFQGMLAAESSDWAEVAERSVQVLLNGIRSER